MNARAVVANSTPAFSVTRAGRGFAATGPIVLAAALIALQLVAVPAAAQLLTEFSAGIPPAPSPRGIVLGPDNNIWFTEQTGNRIGRITPAGVVTEFSAGMSPGANPGGLTVGSDNNIWFVERTGNRIGKIIAIPANGIVGTITEFPLPQPNSLPVSIAAGPDGALWFLENTGNRVGRITTTGTITEFSAGISANAGLSGIWAGPDNNLWFTEATTNKIGQMTTAGVVLNEFSAGITAGANLNDIKTGPDGNLWFTELNGNRVGKITTAGLVTEYSAGISANSGPRSISPGPDGNLWFTETSGNRIGRVSTSGVVTEFGAGISPGASPWNVVAGSDGNLWFTELTGSRIGQITPAGVVTEFITGIDQGAAPVYIAKGPDNNLWFTEYGADAIGQITTAGVVTQFSAGITPGAGPGFIAAGPDGNLWFTENAGNRIGRITPAGVVTEFSAGITPAADLQVITAGPDGNMWFGECAANRIGRITMTGSITEFSAGISPNSCPVGIVAGPDGNLWFTEYDGNRIGRITTSGVVTEFSAGISPNSGPNDITLGADNNLWFTEYVGNRIGRITTSGTVTEFSTGVLSGKTPNGIAAGPDGNLWFTADIGNHIGRITPAGVVTIFPQAPTTGSEPFGITAGPDGNMWFTEVAGARIGRFLTPASTYVVTNNNDSGAGSLRDAIARANADPGSNTVTFDPAVTGTITLTSGQIQISGPVSIVGPGAGTLTVNGNAASRIFSIFATDPACPAIDGTDYLVSISGMHLTNARRIQSNAGGAIFTEHSLALDGMTLDNNVAADGGGLFFQAQYAGQALTITNSQFLNNKAQPIGPTDVNVSGGAMVVFERCSGTHVAPVVNISGSVFSGNQALPAGFSGFGGAIHLDTIGSATITDTRIVNNQVVLPASPPPAQIYRSGGLHVHMKSLRIERSEISGNSLVDATASDLTRGGGLITYNTAADLQGAGDTMNATIVNSTISGNSSPATGGAMMISGNVAMEFDNSTVSDNTAPQTRTGGVVMAVSAGQLAPTLTLASTILANNSSDGGDIAAGVATFPTFTISAANSLIRTICPLPSCNITVTGAGNLPTGTDPMLGPLATNGGPTQTQALLAGSPAINAGSNPLSLTTDQRGPGHPRVVDAAADMGAFEYNPVVPPNLLSAASRRVHGAAGTFDLPLTLTASGVVNHSPTTDPRQGPNQTIVFTFDKPLNAATVTINEGVATAGAPTFSGNAVVVPLTGVSNQQYVTVTLTNVASTDGGTGGTGEARIGFLLGDVNGSRVVSIADLGIVNSVLAQLVTASNYLRDVNVSGTLTLADKGITNANLTKALVAP